jgi:hypothetical protein
LYWRDGWPVITTRARINDEVAFAVRDTGARMLATQQGVPWPPPRRDGHPPHAA